MAKQNEKNTSNLTPISKLGEFGLIKHLTKNARLRHKSSIKGIGDDAAVLQEKENLQLITTDLLIEGIHFDIMYSPFKHLGYKAVTTNLSDIYAMNGEAKQILVSLAVSSRFSVEALEEFYDGIHTACMQYDVDLIGGDTSSTHKGMVISITAIGSVKEADVVYRSTGNEGDYVCVSGDLGSAYLGLQLLEREKRIYLDNPDISPELDGQNYVVGRQLRPEARKDIIDILSSYSIKPTSMIDISDGLSSELLHICEASQVGCHIFEENIPIHPKAHKLALNFNLNPVTCALNGGEDYELLFTVSPKDIEKLKDFHGITNIGRLTKASEGKKLFSKSGKSYDIIAQGWQHIV